MPLNYTSSFKGLWNLRAKLSGFLKAILLEEAVSNSEMEVSHISLGDV